MLEGEVEVWSGSQGKINNCLYLDYVGSPLIKNFPKEGQYLLSEEQAKKVWDDLIEDKGVIQYHRRLQLLGHNWM